MAQSHVAVVTGGSRGIGLAIATALVRRGHQVVISGRDPGALARARAGLEALGEPDRIAAIEADVRQPESADALIAAAVQKFGGLDILVNNAGVGRFRDVAEMSPEEWRDVLDTNLSGVFYGCRAAIPHLRRRGGGWIINVSSLAGRNAFAGGAAYCASKAGLNAFSEALMQEVRHDNIRVSAIMPGSVRTGFTPARPGTDDEWKLDPADVAEVVIDLLRHPARSLPSRIEIRPSKPPRKP